MKVDVANPLAAIAAALVFVMACSSEQGVVTIKGRMVNEYGSPFAGQEVRILRVRVFSDGAVKCVGLVVRDEEAHTYEVAVPRTETNGAGKFVIKAYRAPFEEEGFCVQLFRSGMGQSALARSDGDVVRYGVPENERVIDIGEITIVD